jgi:ribosome-associated translation inhibitor RaiA
VVRTVKVGLEADVAAFIAAMKASAAELEQVDDKVKALDRDLEKIPPDALKAAAAVKALGDGAKGAGDQLKTIGDKAAGLSVLDAKIQTSRAEVRKLTDEFIKTGDVDVFQKLGKESASLKNLENVRKKLSNEIEEGFKDGTHKADGVFSLFLGGVVTMAKKIGLASGDAAIDSVGSLFKAMPAELKAVLVAGLGFAAVAAVPVIVAALDAAFLLALGAGGLAAGIMLAAKDANVSKAFNELGKDIRETLDKAVTPFRSQLVDGAKTLGAAFDQVTPNIDRMGASLSKAIAPLSRGLAGFLENSAGGLEQALAGGAGLLTQLGDWLPKLGQEIGDLSHAFAEAGVEGGAFFQFLLMNIDAVLKGVEWLTEGVHFLSGIMGMWTGSYRPLSPALAEDAGAMDNLTASAINTEDTFGNLISSMGKFPKTADDVAAAITDKIVGSMLAMDNASLNTAEALTKVTESFKKNGDEIDINSKKGQANRESVLSAVSANLKLYDTNIATGMSAKDAAAAYDQNTQALERQLRKAGLTKQEVDDLIGKYRNVPKTVNTDIAAKGLANAINDLREAIILANNLDGKSIHINSYLHQHYTQGFDDAGLGHQGAKHAGGIVRRAATGLIIPPSDPGTVLTAEPETGGEAYIPLRGITQNRAMGLAQTVGNNYGFNVVPQNTGGGAVVVKVEASIGGTNRELAGLLLEMQRRGDLPFVVKT